MKIEYNFIHSSKSAMLSEFLRESRVARRPSLSSSSLAASLLRRST